MQVIRDCKTQSKFILRYTSMSNRSGQVYYIVEERDTKKIFKIPLPKFLSPRYKYEKN